MSKYKHIFFDLDRTLWDFDANAIAAFEELHHKYQLAPFCDIQSFARIYRKHNERLWTEFRRGNISKERLRYKRFILVLNELGIMDDAKAQSMSSDYLEITPQKTALEPNTIEVLEYLYPKYGLHIITNGFEHTQQLKIQNTGLDKYFDEVITAETIAISKPQVKIFDYALRKTGINGKQALMIGDDLEVDIIGARKAGIDQVYYNPQKKQHKEVISYEITDLKELMNLL
jgi:putative hydrolase of the HAD superfamily